MPTRHCPDSAIFVALACLVSTSPGVAQNDILARSRAIYASLKSYADTGMVVHESGTNLVSRHTFKTYYRAPRHFYFEFDEDKKDGGSVLAIWCEGGDFQSWWTDTKVLSKYPPGQGVAAFTMSISFTVGSSIQIPSLLFATAGLSGTIAELTEVTAAGTEPIDGRPAHKLIGVARSKYAATGHIVNERRATVWIDAETLLIRKIFEDTPTGLPTGSRNRITTTFEPQANPALDDSKFRFTVPK
jgi:outer membrane lipoprotein-sorting protein